ncbi:hypothetical protein HYPSUDRAFT_65988 [Hypholoma sublateritium FD-334 SS-4]|uniref:Uncharacterized protein n=1 Tax=Hypholoma sublateritium (strain FD-334 SS-4) TaxID=945553 RepID=A0A0D2MJL0_HYPSF|nr:hypothetical protein HYPSUDRAFT_65988 [Hypholoma sublateritium FD-334 SS-4]
MERPIVETGVRKTRLKVKSGAELYRKLGDGSYGTPLYIPQPNARLSKADRREGLQPGSIGKFTSAGSFDVLHNNVFRNALTSDTSIPVIQTPFEDDDIIEFKQFSAGSFLATPGIYRDSLDGSSSRTLATFGCDADTEEGALLMLPQGAHCERLVNMARLFDYISQSGSALYAYANNIRGRQFKNGELSVVYNCHKSTSWAIATFQNTSRERKIRMNLVSSDQSAGLQSAGARYAWDYQGTVQAKVGPEDENDDLAGGDDVPHVSSLRNQCLFARTIKIRLAGDVWQQQFPEQDVMVGLQDEHISEFDSRLEKSVSPPPSSSRSSSIPSSISSSALFSHSEPPSSQDLESVYSPPTSIYHFDGDNASVTSNDNRDLGILYDDSDQWLSDIITTFLLDRKSGAKVAISNSRNWASCASLNRSASEILDDICSANDICEQNGLVYFEPKESFLSTEESTFVVQALKYRNGFLQEFLFGSKQSCEERCTMLTELMHFLQEDRSFQVPTGSRPTLLDGHPFRTVNIDFALPCSPEQRQLFDPALQIANLRNYQNFAQVFVQPNIAKAVYNARLGQSLLRRFWDRDHEDDLHEAIFFFTNALALTPAHSHRQLEIYLDISLALFFRYQLFEQSDDLAMLLSVLQLQKDALESSSCSWIWDGIDALQPLYLHVVGENTTCQSSLMVKESPDVLDNRLEMDIKPVPSTSAPSFAYKQSWEMGSQGRAPRSVSPSI